MDGWQRIDGTDWLCVEPGTQHRVEPDADPTVDSQVEAGLVFAHGYAHETPAQAGIGAVAARILVGELSRPRETDLGVVELSAVAQVNLQDTVIRIAGTIEAVRLGLAALDRVLRDPTGLDLSYLPSPPTFGWSGWGDELGAWFGMGSCAFAAANDDLWSGDPDQLLELIGGLHPSRGTRMVGWTSEPSLLGVFGAATDEPTAEVTSEPRADPLRWREPGPVADGPASLGTSVHENLLTARLPASRVNELAVRLLARTVHRRLVLLSRLVSAIELTVEQVGGDLLVAMRVVPGERPYQAAKTRLALDEALQASASWSDAALVDELRRARQAESLNLDLAPLGRAIDAARSGTRPTWSEIVQSYDTMTTDDLRLATTHLHRAALYGVPIEKQAPSDPPLWQPPPVDVLSEPCLKRRSVIALPLQGIDGRRPSLRINDSALELTSKPPILLPRGMSPGPKTRVRQAVDLAKLAVRIDYGATYTTLIDQNQHSLTITWPAYLRRSPVRTMVDDATPPGATITTAVDPAMASRLKTRFFKMRLGLVIQAIVYSGFILLLIFHPVTGHPRSDDQRPVISSVAAGRQVSLANGTTLLVSSPLWSSTQNGARQTLSASVRACGGGKTIDQNGTSDQRNTVGPDQFEITGISPASRAVGSADPLQPSSLAQGQCASGAIAFSVDATAPVGGAGFHYTNSAGDDLTWTVG